MTVAQVADHFQDVHSLEAILTIQIFAGTRLSRIRRQDLPGFQNLEGLFVKGWPLSDAEVRSLSGAEVRNIRYSLPVHHEYS